MQRMTSRQSGHRAGFTILELLVVIGVIAILASLGFVMVKNFGQTSRDAQTEATIKKIDAALQDRLQAMERLFDLSNRRAQGGRTPVYIDDQQVYTVGSNQFTDREMWDLDGSGVPDRNFIELRARKKYKQKHFPMNFSEIDHDHDGIQDLQPPNPSAHIPETENAEVLYYFLTQGAKFGSEEVAVVDFIDREIADTDGDGLMEIADGWGKPIRFYRWPTRLVRPRLVAGTEGNNFTAMELSDDSTLAVNRAAIFLIGNVPALQTLQIDPEDPLGDNTAPPEVFEQNFHTARTWHAPLVVSAGADGEFGLLSPTQDGPRYGQLAQPDNDPDRPTEEFLQDNISNLKLRVGGR